MSYNIKGDVNVLRRIFSKFLNISSLSGKTGNNVLVVDSDGDVESSNVEFLISGSTAFNTKLNVSDFNNYSATTNTIIGSKLNKADFDSYSANTLTNITGKVSTIDFNSYSANTNNLIGTKLKL